MKVISQMKWVLEFKIGIASERVTKKSKDSVLCSFHSPVVVFTCERVPWQLGKKRSNSLALLCRLALRNLYLISANQRDVSRGKTWHLIRLLILVKNSITCNLINGLEGTR